MAMTGARQLPEPLAQGDLAQTPFAHVLLYVHKHALEGTLVVWEPPRGEERPPQDRILFERGAPVAARLREPASRLDRGLLPLFPRTRGPYAFYERADLVGRGEGVLVGEVAPQPLIAASLRGSSRDDVVAHVVAGLGAGPLRIERGAGIDALGLLPEERAFVDVLRAEPMPAARWVELSALPPKMAERIVYLLAITKCVAPWDGAEAKPGPRRIPSDLRPPKPASRPPASGAPPRRSESQPPSAPPPGLSAAHREHWAELAARAAKIEDEDYFEMLGVPRDASSSAVQTAYFNLIKTWHPDRLPRELAPLRPRAELVFRYLTRAQETLSDDAKRGPYLASVQDGGGTPNAERKLARVIQAAMEFRKVEVLLKRRELDEALTLIEECLEANDEEPDYHATMGWILLQRAAPGADHSSALAALDRALALSATHDRALYYKGMVLERMGRSAEATECHRRAAQVNPKNIEAVRMVRLAEMRGESGKAQGPEAPKPAKDAKGSAAAKESFFGKLLGKK